MVVRNQNFNKVASAQHKNKTLRHMKKIKFFPTVFIWLFAGLAAFAQTGCGNNTIGGNQGIDDLEYGKGVARITNIEVSNNPFADLNDNGSVDVKGGGDDTGNSNQIGENQLSRAVMVIEFELAPGGPRQEGVVEMTGDINTTGDYACTAAKIWQAYKTNKAGTFVKITEKNVRPYAGTQVEPNPTGEGWRFKRNPNIPSNWIGENWFIKVNGLYNM